MADNVSITPGAGETVATDEVAVNGGSVAQVQFVKLVDGASNGTDGIPGSAADGLSTRETLVGGLSNARTTALASSLVVKASAGVLFGLQGYTTVSQFLQIHDASSLPADTAVPEEVIPIVANEPFSLDFGRYGIDFATGIVVCNSTSGPTKTLGSADCWFSVQYL